MIVLLLQKQTKNTHNPTIEYKITTKSNRNDERKINTMLLQYKLD